jgi:anti-sigma B factor antagonist
VSPVDLQLTVRNVEGVTVLDVVGEVDLYTAPQLEEALRKAEGGAAPRVAVNLAGVAYLDSTALRVLTESHKRALSRGGAIAVIVTQTPIQKIFRITGLGNVLPVVTTEREAIAQLRTSPPTTPGD